MQGYTNDAFPNSANVVPLTVNYYDDYSFPNSNAFSTTATGITTQTRGLLTGSKTAILNPDGTYGSMLQTNNYYDEEGRLRESIAQNNIGGSDRVVNDYNFTNQVTKTVRTHSSTTIPGLVITNAYTYDHMGRKTRTLQQTGAGQSNVVISKLAYNEIGQLQSKQLHGVISGADTTYLQKVDYAYNERGWLTGAGSSKFSFSLAYNTNITTGAIPQFNGNIAEMYSTSDQTGTSNRMKYTYDALNRLTAADHNGGLLSENGITYDNLGNILSLNRNGSGAASLSYGYTGNQLTTVKNNNSAYRSYGYDANGNASSDGNITDTKQIFYNMLNLPRQVTKNGNAIATYTYDASGEKLQNTGADGTWDYDEGIVYQNNVLAFVNTEEGRVIPDGTSYSYQYNLKDHLGNVRVSMDKNGVMQEDEYYAFGLRSPKYDSGSHNRYLYNGKEVQADLANQYDYGARFYDPVIARWTSVDPQAEKDRRWSPYVYGFDNAIRFEDPDGMWPGQGFLTDAWNAGVSSFKGYYSSIANTVKSIPAQVKGLSSMSAGQLGKAYVHTMIKMAPINIVINNAKDVVQGVHGLATGNGKEFGSAVGRQVANTATVAATDGVASGAGKVISAAKGEVTVFRAFGGDAKMNGYSWTPDNPSSVPNFRDAAGLPSGGESGATNTGQFIIKGTANRSDIIDSYLARPLDGNKGGGVMEYIINPQNVTPTKISTAKPAL